MVIFTRVMSIEQDGRRRGGRDGYKNIVQLYEDNVDIGQELRYLKYYLKFGQLEIIRSLKLIMYLKKKISLLKNLISSCPRLWVARQQGGNEISELRPGQGLHPPGGGGVPSQGGHWQQGSSLQIARGAFSYSQVELVGNFIFKS